MSAPLLEDVSEKDLPQVPTHLAQTIKSDAQRLALRKALAVSNQVEVLIKDQSFKGRFNNSIVCDPLNFYAVRVHLIPDGSFHALTIPPSLYGIDIKVTSKLTVQHSPARCCLPLREWLSRWIRRSPSDYSPQS
eukprot:GILI01007946.1.p1 GENE.GILI01007946.1~~GILI01007946.1.p1  ORF type:complete len:134 (-),score=10.15 GILI01007946.1:46-447(-)